MPDEDVRGIKRLVQHADRALSTADATRLLAERTFHYAQRAPFLMRLQARVATHELITEGFYTLRSAPLFDRAPALLKRTLSQTRLITGALVVLLLVARL